MYSEKILTGSSRNSQPQVYLPNQLGAAGRQSLCSLTDLYCDLQKERAPDRGSKPHSSSKVLGTLPQHNLLLAALPERESHSLLSGIELIDMPLGMVLGESGCSMGYVFFPSTAVVSLSYVLEDGACAEMAVVGNEGLVGVSLLMGSSSSSNRAEVQTAGLGFRLKASILKEQFDRAGSIQNLLLRYTLAMIAQMSQTAVCNRHHTLEQRVCRRLLSSLDRQADSEIVVTQERVAHMLGVRREGVTAAALKLQSSGLIRYRRGRICVIDRSGLERRSCECYAVVKREYERLLPAPPLTFAELPVFSRTPRLVSSHGIGGSQTNRQA